MVDIRFINNIHQIHQLSAGDKDRLQSVVDKYRFRANDYYLSLIDWTDPADPIRRLIVPDVAELSQTGSLDACNEVSNYVTPGCQHKYPHTALLIATQSCAAYCRYCFRKRLFMDGHAEQAPDLNDSIDYIRGNDRISNVLITGGDPLTLSTRRLEGIIRQLRSIDHVAVIRIGSKSPAFNPFRIIDDPELPAMLSRYSTRKKRIYVMCHFDVVNEMTDSALLALDMLQQAGVILCNQTPIIRGVNDSAEALASLMRKLTRTGVQPYYFFQCRPTAGNHPYAVPIVDGYEYIEEGKRQVSGLGKRVRFVMSHVLGKIEIIGVTDDYIYLKFHRARYREDEGRFMIFYRNDEACWLDELIPADGQPHPVHERHGDMLTPRVHAVAQ